MIPMYNIDITETATRNGHFTAICRELLLTITSSDPEHDICHQIAKAGFPDGSVQFWRNGMASLSHPSAHRMGKMRITLKESFPLRVKRDQGQYANLFEKGKGEAAGGQES